MAFWREKKKKTYRSYAVIYVGPIVEADENCLSMESLQSTAYFNWSSNGDSRYIENIDREKMRKRDVSERDRERKIYI